MNENTRPTGSEATTVSAPSKSGFKRLSDCNTLQEAFGTREIRDRIAEALPKHMDPTSMLRTFIQAASKTPLIYQCDYRQAIGAFLSLSYLGLTPNTPLQLVHLIPFRAKRWNPNERKQVDVVDLNVIIGYPGYLELAHRSGLIRSVHCDVVLPGEHFRAEQGTHKVLEHRKEIDQDTTGLIPRCAYAFVDMAGEGSQFEVMGWAEIMQTRDRSQAYRTAANARDEAQAAGKKNPRIYLEAPWVRDVREMAKKTPFRKLAKWLPKCPELRAGVALEDAQDGGRLNYGAVIDGEVTPMDGIPTIEEDADPVDPATAFGVRKADTERHAEAEAANEAARSERLRVEAEAARARAAAARAPRSVATPAPTPTDPHAGYIQRPTPTPAPTPSRDQHSNSYESILIDAQGEITGVPHFTPASFARAFMALWNDAGPDADALRDNNEEALIEAIEADAVAAGILAEMDQPEVQIDVPGPNTETYVATYTAINPPVERGRISWASYVKLLKQDILNVPTAHLSTWVEAQRETLTKCPKAQRVLIVRAIVETFGMQRLDAPGWLADIIATKARDFQEHGPADDPGPTNGPEPEPEQRQSTADERWVDQRIAEMAGVVDRDSFSQLMGSTAVKTMMARLRRENRELFIRADNAFTAKHHELPLDEGE